MYRGGAEYGLVGSAEARPGGLIRLAREDVELMGEEQSELAAAVAAVEDPLLRRSVGELGMLREVAEGRRRTRVVLAVPADPYPAQEELESRVRGAVAARKPGVRLDLDVETMDAVAVAALGAQLHGPGGPGGDEAKNRSTSRPQLLRSRRPSATRHGVPSTWRPGRATA